jgi:hypothetical protein
LPSRTIAAAADTDPAIAAAQTAASLENLAITVYGQVAQLPVMQTVTPTAASTITALLTRTVQQHTDHLTAFNTAAVRLGGRAQTAADSTVATTVIQPALSAATTPADVLNVLAKLELIAAETYATQVAVVSDRQLRNSLASITGVEHQHNAVLLAIAGLLGNSQAELVTFPWPAADLPAAAATSGTPSAFLRSDQARPADEGALR